MNLICNALIAMSCFFNKMNFYLEFSANINNIKSFGKNLDHLHTIASAKLFVFR